MKYRFVGFEKKFVPYDSFRLVVFNNLFDFGLKDAYKCDTYACFYNETEEHMDYVKISRNWAPPKIKEVFANIDKKREYAKNIEELRDSIILEPALEDMRASRGHSDQGRIRAEIYGVASTKQFSDVIVKFAVTDNGIMFDGKPIFPKDGQEMTFGGMNIKFFYRAKKLLDYLEVKDMGWFEKNIAPIARATMDMVNDEYSSKENYYKSILNTQGRGKK